MTLMEESKVRTLKEIDQEYTDLCAQIGHLEFQLQEQLVVFKERLKILKAEAIKVKQDSVAVSE